MAFKTSKSPLSFAHRVTLLIFILIVFSSRLSQVMATKTGNADKSITFISSELDWSKDLEVRLDRSGGERAGGFRRAAALQRVGYFTCVYLGGGDINPAPI